MLRVNLNNQWCTVDKCTFVKDGVKFRKGDKHYLVRIPKQADNWLLEIYNEGYNNPLGTLFQKVEFINGQKYVLVNGAMKIRDNANRR